jgi:competence protein ComEC
VAFITWTGHVAAGLPGAAVRAPPVLVLLATGAVSAAVVWAPARRAVRPTVIAACIAAVVAGGLRVAAGPGSGPATGGTGVAFLDVGQGDATVLFDQGHAVLIDTGPPDGSVVERLRSLGVRRLDALLLTHAQADHDGAGAEVVRALPVGALLDGRDGVRDPAGAALDAARPASLRAEVPRAGSTIRAGAITLRVLSPGPGRTGAGEDPNARAVVTLAQVGGLRILLTADAESDVLAPLDPPPVDVLKVSHHGSADPGLATLLTRLRPRLAVIEVGAHNTYGHPAPATLGALHGAGVPALRTDRDGTVIVSLHGGRLRVQRRA